MPNNFSLRVPVKLASRNTFAPLLERLCEVQMIINHDASKFSNPDYCPIANANDPLIHQFEKHLAEQRATEYTVNSMKTRAMDVQ